MDDEMDISTDIGDVGSGDVADDASSDFGDSYDDSDADTGDIGEDVSDEGFDDTDSDSGDIDEIDEDVPDDGFDDTDSDSGDIDEIDEDVPDDGFDDTDSDSGDIDEIDEDVPDDGFDDTDSDSGDIDEIDEDVPDDGFDDTDSDSGDIDEIDEDVPDDGFDDTDSDSGDIDEIDEDVPDDGFDGTDSDSGDIDEIDEDVPDDGFDGTDSDSGDVPDDEFDGTEDTSDDDDIEMSDADDDEDGDDPSGFRELKPLDDKISIADRNSDMLDWEGEKGNSKRVPKDSETELKELLSEYGIDGIEYKNGDVDFSPVSKYDLDFEDESALYKSVGESIPIGKLLTDDGSVSRDKFNSIIRNEWQKQAQQQVVDRIRSDPDFASDFQQKTGVDTASVRSVSGLNDELKRNGLTIHETPDCQKMQLVPTKIHDAFKHSGGTAEMLERLIDADTHSKVLNNE